MNALRQSGLNSGGHDALQHLRSRVDGSHVATVGREIERRALRTLTRNQDMRGDLLGGGVFDGAHQCVSLLEAPVLRTSHLVHELEALLPPCLVFRKTQSL